MARRAIEAWRDLEDEAGEPLLRTTGGLDLGDPDGLRTASLGAAGERLEIVPPAEAAQRWPGIRFPDVDVLVQPDAGVCLADRTIAALAATARARGATIEERTEVTSIRPAGDGVELVAGDRAIVATAAVVAAGAWASPLLAGAGIDLPLEPTLEQVTYFRGDRSLVDLPTVVDWTRDPIAYTVPEPRERGAIKVALHRAGPTVDPDEPRGEPDEARADAVVRYVAETFPGATPTGESETCLYANTADEDFVLDRWGPVIVASPCSGHGFKFAPLVGELVADLATGEEPTVPLARFALDRPGLRG
jgi:sarcosine oxidase